MFKLAQSGNPDLSAVRPLKANMGIEYPCPDRHLLMHVAVLTFDHWGNNMSLEDKWGSGHVAMCFPCNIYKGEQMN